MRPAPADPATRPDDERPGRADVLAVGAVVAVAVVARFVTTSPLWLDEALSVNIAALPLAEIPGALRQDGHPPLYYLLLHGWMEVFGSGDAAVRALSGLWSIAALPLAWIAGRRRAGRPGGLAVLLLTAVSPYSVRYATETRMYAMVWVLALAGWLLADDLRRRPSRRRWTALAIVTGAALLTHYWAIYLGGAAVVALAVWWWRGGADQRRAALRIGSALAAGTIAFLPWLPSFLHQAAHTGTPWGTASRPARALTELAGGLGGGERFPESPVFGWTVLVLALLGLLVVRTGDRQLVLDLRSGRTVRAEMAVVGLTLALGLAAGLVSSSTFVARYAAVFLPLLLIAAGVGLARLPPRAPRRVVAAGLVALAAFGIAANVIDDRTQGDEFAEAITARGGTDDLVAFCPDQLGPSTLRELPDSFGAVGLPALERPDRIDWVDYADRQDAADPAAVADAVLQRAGGGDVWLVYNSSYRTYEGFCERVFERLSTARSTELVVPHRSDVFENAALYRFPAG